MADDVLITPASRKIEFKDSDGNVDAVIQTDSSGNLEITNVGGDISIGDTTSDVYIGDGTNNVDIVFEQDGEIRGTSGVTVTVGASGATTNLAGTVQLGGTTLTATGTELNYTDGVTSNIQTQLNAALPKAGGTMTGQLISTRANSTGNGTGQIYLNGATGNRIDFNTNGVAAPTTTTRSAGTKLVLYPNVTASSADYALGIASSTLWYSVPTTTQQFKWYGGTSTAMTLSGAGVLTATTFSGALSAVAVFELTANTLTSASATQQVVDSWATATYISAKYICQIKDSDTTKRQSSEVLVVHDGSSAFITEYAIVDTDGIIATFQADISGGNVRLLVTPTVTNSVIKVIRTAITS